MTSLSNNFGFVCKVGTKVVLVIPRVTMKSVELELKDGSKRKVMEPVKEGLSTWELKEGKGYTAASQEACEKVQAFNDYFDEESMELLPVNDPPHGDIQYIFIIGRKTEKKSEAHEAAMNASPSEEKRIKGAKIAG